MSAKKSSPGSEDLDSATPRGGVRDVPAYDGGRGVRDVSLAAAAPVAQARGGAWGGGAVASRTVASVWRVGVSERYCGSAGGGAGGVGVGGAAGGGGGASAARWAQ